MNFIFDADVRSFFDEVSQSWLIRFVEHRVGDPRIIRLIRKWLKAGVLEGGVVTVSDKGTGQELRRNLNRQSGGWCPNLISLTKEGDDEVLINLLPLPC